MSARLWPSLLCVLTFAGLVTGCGETVNCTLDFKPALIVSVHNADTGEPEADGAFATVVEGEFVVELEFVSDSVLLGVYERPGTYDVIVEKEGFLAWTRTGVVVGEDECHVVPVALDVQLEPDTI